MYSEELKGQFITYLNWLSTSNPCRRNSSSCINGPCLPRVIQELTIRRIFYRLHDPKWSPEFKTDKYLYLRDVIGKTLTLIESERFAFVDGDFPIMPVLENLVEPNILVRLDCDLLSATIFQCLRYLSLLAQVCYQGIQNFEVKIQTSIEANNLIINFFVNKGFNTTKDRKITISKGRSVINRISKAMEKVNVGLIINSNNENIIQIIIPMEHYDKKLIAFSLASADEPFVTKVYNHLAEYKDRIFYYKARDAKNYTKRPNQYLPKVFLNLSKYSIIFLSKKYPGGEVASQELDWIKKRQMALKEDENSYLFFAQLDDTNPEKLNITNYPLPFRGSEEEIANQIKRLIDDTLNLPPASR